MATPKFTPNGFMVFEADTNLMNDDQAERVKLIGYKSIGAAKADTADQAVMAVMGVTKRIGKYAAIPAYFLDFTPNLDEPDSDRLALNP